MWNILECVITEHRMFHARIWIWEKWEKKKKTLHKYNQNYLTGPTPQKLSDRLFRNVFGPFLLVSAGKLLAEQDINRGVSLFFDLTFESWQNKHKRGFFFFFKPLIITQQRHGVTTVLHPFGCHIIFNP